MSIQPDPYIWSIFNLIGQTGANIGQSFASEIQNQRNARLGEEAVRKYVDDPSIANYINAERFVNMGEAIKAAKTAAETEAIQQQNALRSLELLQALSQQQAAPGALDHLSPDEVKSYQSGQQGVRGLLDTASLARQLRISGNSADATTLAQRVGLNPTLIKKMKTKDLMELGKRNEAQSLEQAARSQVALKLMENNSLSPVERRELENLILSEEEFAKFLQREINRTSYGEGGAYAPNKLIQKVGEYVDDYVQARAPQRPSLITPQVQQQAQEGDQQQPARIIGRMEMPTVPPTQPPTTPPPAPSAPVAPTTPPATPPTAPTPEKTDDSQAFLQEVVKQSAQQKATEQPPVEKPVTSTQEAARERRKPISFRSSPKKFIEQAKSYDAYKNWSDKELLDARENNKRLNTIRNQLVVDAAVRSPSYTEKDYQTVKELALKYSLMDNFFFNGVKPSESETIANALINKISKDDFKDLLSTIKTPADLDNAVNEVLNYRRHVKSFVKELPEEVSEGVATNLMDTVVVAGSRGLLAYLDQAPMALIGHAVKGTAASPYVAAGTYALSGAGYIYRYLRNNKADTFFQAFYSKPRNAAEEHKFYDARYRFAEKFRDEFTEEEREQIIDGKYKNNEKLLSLINKTNAFERFIDLAFRPFSAADEKTFQLADKLESKFSNYNQSAVLAAEMFGSLRGSSSFSKRLEAQKGAVKPTTQAGVKPTGARAPEPIIEADAIDITPGKGPQPKPTQKQISAKQPQITLETADGTLIPMKPLTKQSLNLVRKRMKNLFSAPDRTVGPQERIFDQRWDAWAKSPGTMPFETFNQGEGLFSKSPLFRQALISGVYGGVDAALDQMMEDPYWARVTANMGFGVLGQLVDSHYYRVKNRAFDMNHDWYSDMFKDFTKDFKGTTEAKQNKSTVFDIPSLKKQITFSPEGTVISSKSPNKPSNLPEGPVSFNEFKKPQSDNFISFVGLSENLGLDIPDFTRTPPSKKVVVDERSAHRFVESGWDTKTILVENARQKDLAPFIKQDVVTKVLGDSVEKGTVPGTNDLKKIATHLYKEIETASEDVSIETIAKDLNKNLDQLADYFNNRPSLGASFGKANTLIGDVRKTLFGGEFTIKDLIDYHQTINQTKRNLQASLEKEYKPDSELLLDFYRGLDGMIRRSLPKDVQSILHDADNAYFAYKFSEKIDSILKDVKVKEFNEWMNNKNSFDKLAKTIYTEFKDSNVSNVLRKSLVHDDYFRSNLNKTNVELIRNGKAVRKGSAIEEVVDTSELIGEVKQSFFLTALGKVARFVGNLGKNIDLLSIQKRGEQAVKSSPFIIGEDFRPLVDASRDAHDLRTIRTPDMSRTPVEAPILKKIDAFTKTRQKKQAEQSKQEEQQQRQAASEQEDKKKKEEYKKLMDSYKEYYLLRRALMLKFRRAKTVKERQSAIDHLRSVNEKVRAFRDKLPERLLKYFDDEQSTVDEFLRRFG